MGKGYSPNPKMHYLHTLWGFEGRKHGPMSLQHSSLHANHLTLQEKVISVSTDEGHILEYDNSNRPKSNFKYTDKFTLSVALTRFCQPPEATSQVLPRIKKLILH